MILSNLQTLPPDFLPRQIKCKLKIMIETVELTDEVLARRVQAGLLVDVLLQPMVYVGA